MKSLLLLGLAAAALALPEAVPEADGPSAGKLEAMKRAVGSSCTYSSYTGTCQHTAYCESLLNFHVTGYCPRGMLHSQVETRQAPCTQCLP